jgi:hypothetical protein
LYKKEWDMQGHIEGEKGWMYSRKKEGRKETPRWRGGDQGEGCPDRKKTIQKKTRMMRSKVFFDPIIQNIDEENYLDDGIERGGERERRI